MQCLAAYNNIHHATQMNINNNLLLYIPTTTYYVYSCNIYIYYAHIYIATYTHTIASHVDHRSSLQFELCIAKYTCICVHICVCMYAYMYDTHMMYMYTHVCMYMHTVFDLMCICTFVRVSYVYGG